MEGTRDLKGSGLEDNWSRSPQKIEEVDGLLLMGVYVDEAGEELWVSDGTAAGTTFVRDLNEGKFGSRPTLFQAVGDKIFFSAYDGMYGEVLWVID